GIDDATADHVLGAQAIGVGRRRGATVERQPVHDLARVPRVTDAHRVGPRTVAQLQPEAAVAAGHLAGHRDRLVAPRDPDQDLRALDALARIVQRTAAEDHLRVAGSLAVEQLAPELHVVVHAAWPLDPRQGALGRQRGA